MDEMLRDERLLQAIRKLEYSAPGELGCRLADVFREMLPLLGLTMHANYCGLASSHLGDCAATFTRDITTETAERPE